MGKSAPTPPPAPNAQTIINTAGAANADTARLQAQLNNNDYVGPAGSVTWSKNGDQWTQNVNLSTAQQNIYNQQTADEYAALHAAESQIGRVSNSLEKGLTAPEVRSDVPVNNIYTNYDSGGPIRTSYDSGPSPQFNFDQGGPVQTEVGPSDFTTATDRAANAAYSSVASRLNPEWQQQGEQLVSNLRAQGLDENSTAWQNAMDQFSRSKNDAYNQAYYGAVQAGYGEQQALFGEQLGQGQFHNQAVGQQFGQGLQGQQAFNAAQLQGDQENQQQGQFYNAAQAQADAQAQAHAGFFNTAQQQYYQDQQQNAQLYNQAQQQRFQDTAYSQELPINELTALMGMGQISMPQSTMGSTAVAPTNVLGAYQLQNDAAQANYQAQLQNSRSTLGGLFNLGSAVLSKIRW